MQFRVVSGLLIFVGSYLPLAIILAVQDIPKSWWARPLCLKANFENDSCYFNPFAHTELALTFLGLTTISALVAHFALRSISYPFEIEVKVAKAIPNEIINYTFPYVVSFMGISYGDPEKLLGFAVFLLWMFAITYKSGQIVMNPLLLIFGWKLHDASILINGNSRDVRVLKKGSLTPGKQWGQTIQDFYVARD
jgi:hypothetical protein